jgi:DNA-binding MarR family transcriptional regulator
LPPSKYYTGNLHISPYPSGNIHIICLLSTLTEKTADLDAELAPLATEVRVVIGRLIRRLRAEHQFSLTQAAVLGRLDREGPQCIGELATSESVRPQSMSQLLAELEAEQLVSRSPDLADGRRTRIELTDLGRVALKEDRARREGWLAEAISEFTPAEREVLAEAVELLARLSERA